MKDLIKNRLEVKATTSNAKSVLESLPMLIKEFDVDEGIEFLDYVFFHAISSSCLQRHSIS